MLGLALEIHRTTQVDSSLESTRIFWRERYGATPEQARDPRPFAEVLAEKSNQSGGTDDEKNL